MKDKEIKDLMVIRQRYQDATDAWDDNRQEMLVDILMRKGDQWDASAVKERDGRPCLVINKLAGTLKQIIGDQRQNKPSITVKPVDSESDPDIAEIITGLIRNIEQTSSAEDAYDMAFEQAASGGMGFFRIATRYASEDAFEQDICIERIIDPFSVTFDPYAKKADKSDARYCFIEETITKEEFEERYPKHVPADWDTAYSDDGSQWYTGEKVRIAEYFYKEEYTKTLLQLETGAVVDEEQVKDVVIEMAGRRYIQTPEAVIEIVKSRKSKCDRVKWKLVTGHAVIDKRDIPSKYIPVVGVWGDEIWDGQTLTYKSAIRDARDAQKVYNWMRSTAVETIAQAPRQPFLVTPAQIEGFEDQWAQLHRKPMAYLLYNETGQGPPQRMGGSIPDTGAQVESQISSDDIKSTTGIFDASLGARGNETSGRAIIARQREGDVATYVFIDNLTRALKYAGRVLVDMIPKVYDTERIVRVLGEDGAEDWTEINKVAIDPYTGQEVVLNDLTRGKYDVVVNVGPAYSTQRVEAADNMLKLAQGIPAFGQMFIDLIAENLDWPGADKIAERAKKMLPPEMREDSDEEKTPEQLQREQEMAQQAAQQQQLQMQQVMLQMKEMEVNIMEKAASIKEKEAKIAEMFQNLQIEGAKTASELETEEVKRDGMDLDNIKKEQEIRQGVSQ